VYVDDFKMSGGADALPKMWVKLQEGTIDAPKLDLEPPVPLNGNGHLGCMQHDIDTDYGMVEEKLVMLKASTDWTPDHESEEEAPTTPRKESKCSYRLFSTPEKTSPQLPLEATPIKQKKSKAKSKNFSTPLWPIVDDAPDNYEFQCYAERVCAVKMPSIAAGRGNSTIKMYEHDMQGHAEKCVERYLELSQQPESILKPVSTPCIDDHQLDEDGFATGGKWTQRRPR
jgi:hypothetical protein